MAPPMGLLDRKLVRGIMVASIPFYVIGFFLLGNYLGGQYGHKGRWLVMSILLGLAIALYDVYLVIIRPSLKKRGSGPTRET